MTGGEVALYHKAKLYFYWIAVYGPDKNDHDLTHFTSMDTWLLILIAVIGVVLLIVNWKKLPQAMKRPTDGTKAAPDPDESASTLTGDPTTEPAFWEKTYTGDDDKGQPPPDPDSPSQPRGGESTNGQEPPELAEEEETAPETAAPEPVHLGASVPQAVRPGDAFIARFAAYRPEQEEQVRDEFEMLSPDAKPHLGLKKCRWKHSTPVTVALFSEHLTIRVPRQAFVWEGESVRLDFGVAVPDEAPSRRTSLLFEVYIEGCCVAVLGLDLTITADASTPEEVTVTAEPARTVFASYATKDRPRVLDMATALSSDAGIDIFMDCLDLNPGDFWKRELEQEIKNRDFFYLFWSSHAKASEYVEWEWRTALKEKGLTAIKPLPLVPPDKVPPPKELNDLHFNSRYLMIRESRKSGS